MSIVMDAYRALFNTKQRDGEHLNEYTTRFNTALKILEVHTGAHDAFHLTKYKNDLQDEAAKDPAAAYMTEEKGYKAASNMAVAYLFIENSDHKKYGSIIELMGQMKSLKDDRYPKDLVSATDLLVNHRWDFITQKQNGAKSDGNKNNQQSKEQKSEKKADEPLVMSFAQMEGRCYCCGKKGHRSPDCRHKDKIPQDEWAINKMKKEETQLAQTKDQPDVKTGVSQATLSAIRSTATGETKQVGWAGVHSSFHLGEENLRDLILLDSDSTVTIFCNEKYVSNISWSSGPTEDHFDPR